MWDIHFTTRRQIHTHSLSLTHTHTHTHTHTTRRHIFADTWVYVWIRISQVSHMLTDYMYGFWIRNLNLWFEAIYSTAHNPCWLIIYMDFECVIWIFDLKPYVLQLTTHVEWLYVWILNAWFESLILSHIFTAHNPCWLIICTDFECVIWIYDLKPYVLQLTTHVGIETAFEESQVLSVTCGLTHGHFYRVFHLTPSHEYEECPWRSQVKDSVVKWKTL